MNKPKLEKQVTSRKSRFDVPLQLAPAKEALAQTINDSVGTGSEVDVTLNDDTAFVSIAAVGAGVFVRYQAGATSANSDAYVPSGAVKDITGENDISVISVIADGDTAKVRIYEYE